MGQGRTPCHSEQKESARTANGIPTSSHHSRCAALGLSQRGTSLDTLSRRPPCAAWPCLAANAPPTAMPSGPRASAVRSLPGVRLPEIRPPAVRAPAGARRVAGSPLLQRFGHGVRGRDGGCRWGWWLA